MIKNVFFLLCSFLLPSWLLANDPPLPKKAAYQFNLDLRQVENDQLVIELFPPKMKVDKQKGLRYLLPKIVPGTYSIYDFGRFVTDFQAFDKKGRAFEIEHTETNVWVIKRSGKAKRVHRITYRVEDTWDTEITDRFVFEPGGTNFEKDENFVLNQHGLFGYFEGKESLPYYLNVVKPKHFYGSTSLQNISENKMEDLFYASSYHDFVDAPIMYCEPDTLTLHLGETEVLISTFSHSGKIKAKFIAEQIHPLLEAQRAYLGGKLPVDRYAFIIYLSDAGYYSGAYGALEHARSSFYCFLEMSEATIAQSIKDIAAHEFFHIVTPLNIHSEEIHHFDFSEPKMSQHLWLYEGVVEYMASHVQLSQGMMDLPDYLAVISKKIKQAKLYQEDLAFTEMSKHCLHQHQSQYGNVYEKGALIGLCLDLKLRSVSQGKKGLVDLITELSKTFGKDKPFKDEELFDQIEAATNAEVRQFLDTYVAGTEALPLRTLLAEVGLDYAAESEVMDFTLGGLQHCIDLDLEQMKFVIKTVKPLNAFGQSIGLKEGDFLLAWNDHPLTVRNADRLISDFMSTVETGSELVLKVLRTEEDGTRSTVELPTKMFKVPVKKNHQIELQPTLTEQQQGLRDAWMGK